MVEIKRLDDGRKGAFVAVEDETQVGLMAYTWAGNDKFIIDHTEVNPNYSGRGVGNELVMTAVAFARERAIKILPLCPYAKHVFEKTSEIQDVLYH